MQNQPHPAVIQGAPWPTFRRDHRNTACSKLSAEYQGDHPWTFSTGKGIFSTPVIDRNGDIYFGSADHYFYSLLPDGRLKWKFKTGEIIDSAAALPAFRPHNQDTVVVPSGDGFLYCLETRTGEQVWKFDGNEELKGHFNNWFEGNVAVGPDGTLYAGNTNFRYYALTRQGNLKWTYQTGSNAWSIAGIAPDGTIIWGSCDTFIHGVSQQGKRKWRKRTLGFISASAAIGLDGTAYLGSFDSYLYAINARTGKVTWRFKTNDHIYASAALLEDQNQTRLILVGSTDGILYAVNPAGELAWSFDSGAPIRSSPVLGRAPRGEPGWIVYFGNGAGKIYALHTGDGSRRWSYDTTVDTPELVDRSDLNGSPALGETGLYIGGEHGRLCYLPYDYPLHHRDPRGSTAPGEDLPEEAVSLVFVSPGGRLQPAPPEQIPASTLLTFQLLVRKQGSTLPARLNNPPFNQGKTGLQVRTEPEVPLTIQISADGRFLHLIPQTILDPGTPLKIHLEGNCYLGGLQIGNLTLGGREFASFQESFQFQVREPAADPFITSPVEGKSPCFEWTRLAVPIPTMLPSLNQIGFDYLSWLIGVIEAGEPDPSGSGKLLCWAVGAKRDQDNRLVVDPESDFTLPLAGIYRQNAYLLRNQNFTLKITGIPIPFRTFELRGELDRDFSSLPGSAAYASTEVLSIPNFGFAMVLAGLADRIWRKLTAVGTYLARPCPADFTRDLRLETIQVTSGTLTPPGPRKPGSVAVTLAAEVGAAPADKHRGGILLLDAVDDHVIPLNYHQLLSLKANQHGDIAEINLALPGGMDLPERVRVIVLIDIFPIHQVELSVRK